jgi:hypothetical protein
MNLCSESLLIFFKLWDRSPLLCRRLETRGQKNWSGPRAALIYFMLPFLFPVFSWALNYELSVSYAMRRNSFDKDNYYETESTTGSISTYFSEMLALELSYTQAEANRFDKLPGNSRMQVYQKTEVIGADLIFVIGSRKSAIQPYIKGGVAQLNRRQVTYNMDGNTSVPLDMGTDLVPSYGAGIKFNLTQSLSLRLSYDAWRTPLGGGVVTSDSQVRAGLSWML